MAAAAPVLPIFAGEVVDQSGGASEHDSILPPDLTAAELLPQGGSGMDVVPADDGPTESLPALVGAGSASRPTYTILAVSGGNLPSVSSKFIGATPRAAVLKAARRIHKRSGGRMEFDVIMRRVSAKKVDKKLYKYSVKMRKSPRPDGFVTLIDPSFSNTDGKVERSVAKKVRIVPASEHPVYGYVDSEGNLQKGPTVDGGAKVVRSPGTNTLYIVHAGAMPDSINGVPVVKTEYEVASLTDAAITDAERTKWDVAGAARSAAEEEAKSKNDAKKVAAERKKLKERADKEHVKAVAAAKKEKAKAKAAAEKEKLTEKRLKDKAKAKAAKDKAAKDKAAGKKTKAKRVTRQTGSGASASGSAETEE